MCCRAGQALYEELEERSEEEAQRLRVELAAKVSEVRSLKGRVEEVMRLADRWGHDKEKAEGQFTPGRSLRPLPLLT